MSRNERPPSAPSPSHSVSERSASRIRSSLSTPRNERQFLPKPKRRPPGGAAAAPVATGAAATLASEVLPPPLTDPLATALDRLNE